MSTWTRREVNWFLAALALLVIAAVLVTDRLLPDPSPTPVAAAAPSAAAPAQGGMSRELLAELAAGASCQQAAQAFAQPAQDLRENWAEHAEAHHKGMTGQISRDEMRRRWKVTLGRRLVLDPVFAQAGQAMTKACGLP